MRLLIVRHAIAEDREEFARREPDDSRRPLTKAGRRKMRRGAAGLRALVPRIDLLATSPFTRAAETAEIVAGAYSGLEPAAVSELTPDAKYKDFFAWLRTQAHHDVIAIVGHEPYLSGLASLLLSGRNDPILVLKKGAACLVKFDGGSVDEVAPATPDVGAGKARLLWSLTPGQLRRMRGTRRARR